MKLASIYKHGQGRRFSLRYIGVCATHLILAMVMPLGSFGCAPEADSLKVDLEPVRVDLSNVDPEVKALLRELRQVVSEAPTNGGLRGEYGMALEVNGFAQGAMTSYRQAETLDSENLAWPYCQALLDASFGDLKIAVDGLNRALRLDDSFVPAWLWHGTLMIDLNRLASARADFMTAIELGEAFHSKIGEARILLKENRPDQVVMIVSDLMQFHEHPYLQQLLARAKTIQGEELSDELKHAIRERSGLPTWNDAITESKRRYEVSLSARLRQVREFLSREEIEAALELIQPLYEKYPSERNVVTTYIETTRRFSPDDALDLWVDAHERFPHATEIQLALAEHYVQIGDDAHALPYLEEITTSKFPSAWAFAQRGLIHFRHDELGQARQAFEESISLDPAAYQAYYYAGMCDVRLADFESAKKMLLLALERQPDFGWGYLDLAKVEGELGNTADALAVLVKARELGVDSMEIVNTKNWLEQL